MCFTINVGPTFINITLKYNVYSDFADANLFLLSWLFPRNIANPGKAADLVLKSVSECRGRVGVYRPTSNGNLKYFHTDNPYEICIGSKSAITGEPHEDEPVSIQESVCENNNHCNFSYGKILLVLVKTCSTNSLLI